MSRVVFLLEEYSMKVFLEELLPRIFPNLPFLCVPHDGKHDLERSIPRKLRAWQEPGVRFVVVRDCDGRDCRELKDGILSLCQEGRRDDVLVRIACQELEAWYLGEPKALAEVFQNRSLGRITDRARFRDPDAVAQPAKSIATMVGEFQKVSGARQMGRRLTREGNRSRSFQVLLEGLDRLMQMA